MMDGISIIIPVYNTPQKILKRCIDSIEGQSYKDFEVILVDDGSSKECASYIDSLDGDKITVYHTKNQGSAVARNFGVEHAKYDYMMFVDSDDAITPNLLQDAKEAINKHDADIVIGLVKRFKPDEKVKYPEIRGGTYVLLDSHDLISEYVNHMLGFTSHLLTFEDGYVGDGPVARVCKTDLVKQALFTAENCWSDDTIWNLKLSNKCSTIVIVENIWYLYLLNNNSKTRKYRHRCPDEFRYRIRQEYDLVKEIWPNCIKGIWIRIWGDTVILFRTFLEHPKNNLEKKEKLKIYHDCVHNEIYQRMLHNIAFDNDPRISHKLVKQIMRLSMLCNMDRLSYSLWKLMVTRNL